MFAFFLAFFVRGDANEMYFDYIRKSINFTDIPQIGNFFVRYSHFEDQYNSICIEAEQKHLAVIETEFIRSHNHSIRNSYPSMIGTTIITKCCCYAAIGGGPNNWEYGVLSYNQVKSVFEELNSCTLSRGHQVATEGHISHNVSISNINITYNFLHRTSGYYFSTHSDIKAVVKYANVFGGFSSWDTIRIFNSTAVLSYHNVMNCSCKDGPYGNETMGIIHCYLKSVTIENSVLQQCRGDYLKLEDNCIWNVTDCQSDNPFDGISQTTHGIKTIEILYYYPDICHRQENQCTSQDIPKLKVFPIYLFVGISKEIS